MGRSPEFYAKDRQSAGVVSHQLTRGIKTQPSVGPERSLKAEHGEGLVGAFLDPT